MTQQANRLARVSSAFAPVDMSRTASTTFGDLADAAITAANITDHVVQQKEINAFTGDLNVDKVDQITFDPSTADPQKGLSVEEQESLDLTNIAAAIKQGSITPSHGKSLVQRKLKQAIIANPRREAELRQRAASFFGQYGLGEGLLDETKMRAEFQKQLKYYEEVGSVLQDTGLQPFGKAMAQDPTQWGTLDTAVIQYSDILRAKGLNETYLSTLTTEQKANSIVQQQAAPGFQYTLLSGINEDLANAVPSVERGPNGELNGLDGNIDALNTLDIMQAEAISIFDQQYPALAGQFDTYNQAFNTRMAQLREVAKGKTSLEVVTNNNSKLAKMEANYILKNSGTTRQLAGLMEALPRMQINDASLQVLGMQQAQKLSKELEKLLSGEPINYNNVVGDAKTTTAFREVVTSATTAYEEGENEVADNVQGQLIGAIATLEDKVGTSITNIFELAAIRGEVPPELQPQVEEATGVFMQELFRELDNKYKSDPEKMNLVQLAVDPKRGTLSFVPASNLPAVSRSKAYRAADELNKTFRINDTLKTAAELQGIQPNQLKQWQAMTTALGEDAFSVSGKDILVLRQPLTQPTRRELAIDTTAVDQISALQGQLDFLTKQGNTAGAQRVQQQIAQLEQQLLPEDPALNPAPTVEDFSSQWDLDYGTEGTGIKLRDNIQALIDLGLDRDQITEYLNKLSRSARR